MKLSIVASGLFLAFICVLFLTESCNTPLEIVPTEVPSWDIPNDLSPDSSEAAFDELAWQTFIALNWPANVSGSGPDTTQSIPQGDNNYKTVWESYTESFDIYTRGPGNSAPLPSNCPPDPNAKVRNHAQASKVGIANEFIEAAMDSDKKAPLIDLNGQYVRYEVLYNPLMVDYVKQNKTYNKSGLDSFEGTGLDFEEGSLVVKAAWKVLGDNDNPDDFFTSHSYMVYIQDTTSVKNATTPDTPYCSLDYVGLVGMHIAWKTPDHPNWIWMTFEHKDNAPDSTATPPKSGSYSFFNPTRPNCGPSCINKHPAHPADPDTLDYYTPAIPNQTPSQIERVTPVRADAVTTNSQFHSDPLISNTIWENYNLVGVQWTKASSPTSKPFVIEPDSILANTTIETWEQSTASCMKCHQINAENAILENLTADYMWSAFKALNDDPTENQSGAEK